MQTAPCRRADDRDRRRLAGGPLGRRRVLDRDEPRVAVRPRSAADEIATALEERPEPRSPRIRASRRHAQRSARPLPIPPRSTGSVVAIARDRPVPRSQRPAARRPEPDPVASGTGPTRPRRWSVTPTRGSKRPPVVRQARSAMARAADSRGSTGTAGADVNRRLSVGQGAVLAVVGQRRVDSRELVDDRRPRRRGGRLVRVRQAEPERRAQGATRVDPAGPGGAGRVPGRWRVRRGKRRQGAPDAPVEPLVGGGAAFGGGAAGGLTVGGFVVVPPPPVPDDPPVGSRDRHARQRQVGRDRRADLLGGRHRPRERREVVVEAVQPVDDRSEPGRGHGVLLAGLLEQLRQGVVVAAEDVDRPLDGIPLGDQGAVGVDLEPGGHQEGRRVHAGRQADRDPDVVRPLRLLARRRRPGARGLAAAHGTVTELVFVAAATLVSLSCRRRQ